MKPLPSPPDDCAGLALAPVSTATLYGDDGLGPWFRIFKAPEGVANARPWGDPLWRFDCPLSYTPPYGVWYGSRSEVGAFLEVFGDDEGRFVTPDQRAGRMLGSIRTTRPLNLLDVSAPAVLGILATPSRLDARFESCADYDLTQAWSAAFHGSTKPSTVDGLIYRGRKAGNSLENACIALFYDRAEPIFTKAGAPVSVDHRSLAAARALFTKYSNRKWA